MRHTQIPHILMHHTLITHILMGRRLWAGATGRPGPACDITRDQTPAAPAPQAAANPRPKSCCACGAALATRQPSGGQEAHFGPAGRTAHISFLENASFLQLFGQTYLEYFV